MKPSSGSTYLDDNITQFNTIHCILFMLSKEAMLSTKITIFEKNCQIRASKNISGLVKVTVTSPVGLMKCFLNVEPWHLFKNYIEILRIIIYSSKKCKGISVTSLSLAQWLSKWCYAAYPLLSDSCNIFHDNANMWVSAPYLWIITLTLQLMWKCSIIVCLSERNATNWLSLLSVLESSGLNINF